RHINPVSVWILDSMVGILVGLGVDLGGKSGVVQPALDLIEVVDLKSKVVDALLLVFSLNFNERDVDVAVRHVYGAAKSALGFQSKNLLIKLDHFFPVFGHHRYVS